MHLPSLRLIHRICTKKNLEGRLHELHSRATLWRSISSSACNDGTDTKLFRRLCLGPGLSVHAVACTLVVCTQAASPDDETALFPFLSGTWLLFAGVFLVLLAR